MREPCAKKYKKKLKNFGILRQDDYYWLNKRDDKEVLDYLQQENVYCDFVMKDTEELQEQLFNEIKNRIKEDDSSVPCLNNGYWYYSRVEKGREYPIYCREKDGTDRESIVLLDVNIIAEGQKYCNIGEIMVSDNNEIMAYSVDFVGRRIYDIYIIDLKNNEIIDKIENTTGDFVWAADNKTLFYTTQNRQLRADKVWRYCRPNRSNDLVFHEKDAKFDVGLCRTKSDKYVFIYSDSTLSTEFRYIEADKPDSDFRIFLKREANHEYDIDHKGDFFYIMTNWKAKNFRLMRCEIENPAKENWKEIIANRDDVKLEDYEIFEDFLVVEERKNALNNIRIMDYDGKIDYFVPVEEEIYDICVDNNPNFNTKTLRYSYTSLTTPTKLCEIDMLTRESRLLKQQEVLDPDFKQENYVSKRIWAMSHDGVKVPISLVYRHNKSFVASKLLLYGYGSYGYSLDVCFNSTRLSLLDRGFIFAIAHVRGGEEMGRDWYEDGKFLKKKNSFLDFIACAEKLIAEGYSSPEKLSAMGGSAGGLLVTAVANMRPDLFKAIIAEVPFVDVLTTMLDEDLPLTVGEYDEWGNPNEKDYFDYISSYSPYDNIKAQNYPAMLVTAAYHDSQVQYWEAAKYVAKLRSLKSNDNILLLKTEMSCGHSGASGRYQSIKELAFIYAFLIFIYQQ